MECNRNAAASLEQLLESLIKMVGKSNQTIAQLQQRISQLEWMVLEQGDAQNNHLQFISYPAAKRKKF